MFDITFLGLNNLDFVENYSMGNDICRLYLKEQNYSSYHGTNIHNFVVSYVLNYYEHVCTKFYITKTEAENYLSDAKMEIKKILSNRKLEKVKELAKKVFNCIEENRKLEESLYKKISEELKDLRKLEPFKNIVLTSNSELVKTLNEVMNELSSV